MGTLGLWSFRALTTHRAPSDWPTPSSYSAQPRYHSNDFFFEQVISRIFYTERGEEGGEEGAELQDQEESDSGVELQDEGEAVQLNLAYKGQGYVFGQFSIKTHANLKTDPETFWLC